MNLPETAIEFLGSFNGLYSGYEHLFERYTTTKLPMVHVHCFLKQSEAHGNEEQQICERISASLGHVVKPGDPELVIHEVRDVAPKKKMFCASFRLPAAVVFGSPDGQKSFGSQKSGQLNNATGTAQNLVTWSPNRQKSSGLQKESGQLNNGHAPWAISSSYIVQKDVHNQNIGH